MNKIFLMGRLTKEPEIRYTTTNIAKCSFTLAVDRRFVKAGEERQTDFINIVAWRNQAEFCHKYFSKGQRVVVVGSLQNRSWDDAEGKRHYMTEVIAEEVYFADSRKGEGAAAQPSYRPTGPGGLSPAPDMGDSGDGFYKTDSDIVDDDLPF